MIVAGSSLVYSRLSLDEACDRLAQSGFAAVDVAMQEGWAHADPSAAVEDATAVTERIAGACDAAALEPVALNVNVGEVPLATELERVEAVVDVAVSLGVDVVTLPAASTDAPLSDDLDRFRTLVGAVTDRDVTLTVETHWGTHTEDPAVAAEYADGVPGLGYTLDPGHYVVRDDVGSDPWTGLLDDVAHVHVRQAGSGWAEIQVPVADGRLDVAAFVGTLRDARYDGVLTVEYIDSLDGVEPAAAERQAAEMRRVLDGLVSGDRSGGDVT